MMPPHATALAFDAVSLELGGRRILADVSLAVGAGEVLALAGPNGAGKTTLLRVASRVLAPSAGCVRLFGRDTGELSRRMLARAVAVVPQDVQVAFPFRACEVVLMGRSPHLGAFGYESGSDVERARAAMAEVDILELADRSIVELSGGERQLVLIARALAQDARVLLLDEPTAHLDLRHRIQVLRLVRRFAAAGGSVLVVSHDLSLAARTCDRIALLAAGSLLAEGPASEVLTRANLKRAFQIDAEVMRAPDGSPLVVPNL